MLFPQKVVSIYTSIVEQLKTRPRFVGKNSGESCQYKSKSQPIITLQNNRN